MSDPNNRAYEPSAAGAVSGGGASGPGGPRTSRRVLFGLGGAAIAGAAIGAGATVAADRGGSAIAAPTPQTVPFYGATQAGIATPAPARLAFATYDLTVGGTLPSGSRR
jgi:deferrochelatase/peroxidase EfeB